MSGGWLSVVPMVIKKGLMSWALAGGTDPTV